jgi:hypothetical protein
MTSANSSAHSIALEMVGKVLGPVRARMLLDAFLARREQDHLISADDLHAFGCELGLYGGTAETIGAQICRKARLMGVSNDE